MKLPVVPGDELCKVVSKLGFVMVHQKGSHTVWKHDDGRITTIPVHKGKELGRGLIQKILADIDLSVEEYCKMLKEI
jgi:predicted RNA binding protein YcfA (HicA-like mRNA interferase family)